MPLASISAIYDGNEIRPLEPVPFTTPYYVVVTFLSPADEKGSESERERHFWESFGAWSDTRTTEEILADIHTGLSKPEPPSL